MSWKERIFWAVAGVMMVLSGLLFLFGVYLWVTEIIVTTTKVGQWLKVLFSVILLGAGVFLGLCSMKGAITGRRPTRGQWIN